MTIPLILFILPTLFIVILGRAITIGQFGHPKRAMVSLASAATGTALK
jgi:hypothetical protein